MVATRSRRFDAAPTVPNVDLEEPKPYQGKPEYSLFPPLNDLCLHHHAKTLL